MWQIIRSSIGTSLSNILTGAWFKDKNVTNEIQGNNFSLTFSAVVNKYNNSSISKVSFQ